LIAHTRSGALAARGWNGQLRSLSRVGASLAGSKPRSSRISPASVSARSAPSRPAGARPARSAEFCPLGARDAHRVMTRALAGGLVRKDGVKQNVGEDVVVAGRDADGDAGIRGFVGLGRAAHAVPPRRGVVTSTQQAGIDKLVEMEGG
jgi:hypothetical protein